MKVSLSVGVLLAVTAAAAAAETSYLLLHRTPSTSPAWSERAKIYLEPGSAPRYEEVTSKVPKIDAGDARGIYQLALVPADGNKKAVDDNTPMTFAKACHLSALLNESITLHLDESRQSVHGISYDLIGLEVGPHGCPLKSPSSSGDGSPTVRVKLATPQDALSPPPRGPPPTKADGTPLKEGEAPPKEKSFVAKYWYYFVPILILMALPTEMADSANEEEENGGGSDMPLVPSGGGGAAARGGRAKGGAGAGARRAR